MLYIFFFVFLSEKDSESRRLARADCGGRSDEYSFLHLFIILIIENTLLNSSRRADNPSACAPPFVGPRGILYTNTQLSFYRHIYIKYWRPGRRRIMCVYVCVEFSFLPGDHYTT